MAFNRIRHQVPLMHEADARRLLQSPPNDDFISALRAVLKSYRASGAFVSQVQTADLANLSVRSLQRILSDEGVTFSEIVTEVRSELAMELLTNTSLSVKRIAMGVGYSEANNFSRAFKRWTGATPEQFRRAECNDA